jgi:Fe2+ transport system protein FeoA
MNLTELNIDQLGLIIDLEKSYHNHEESKIGMHKLLCMGIVPGLEIRKLSEVATCAEYRVEGNCSRIVISKELSDYIIVDTLDETIE